MDAKKRGVLQGVQSATHQQKRQSRAGQLFGSTPTPDTKNADRFPAFSHGLRRELAKMALTGLVQNRYYSTAKEQAAEMVHLCVQGAKEHPEFALRCAVAARNQNMKLSPVMLLAAVEAYSPDTAKRYDEAILKVLGTFHARGLLEFAEIFRNKVFGKGLGSRQQRLLRTVIERTSDARFEEWTLKYRDTVRILGMLVHAQADRPAWNYCMKGTGKGAPVTPKQVAAKALQSITNPRQFAEKLVESGVPWDAVKAFVPKDPVAWAAIMMNSGPMAVLLNSRSYAEHRVFEAREARDWYRDWALNKIPTSRMLPIDVIKAYEHVGNADVQAYLMDGLAEQLKAIANGPKLPLKTAILMDISRSMKGKEIRQQGVMAATLSLKTDPVFVAAFNRGLFVDGSSTNWGKDRGPAVDMWPGYGPDRGRCPRVQGRTDFSELLRDLVEMQPTGGTDTGIGIRYLHQNRIETDLILLLTDEQQNYSGGPTDRHTLAYHDFKAYRESDAGRNAHLSVINVAGEKWHNFPDPDRDPNISVFCSIHPSVLQLAESLTGDPVAGIEAISLDVEVVERAG